MFLFDLSHDRMAASPVEVVADVQAALIFDESRYLDAARKIGLNAQEREELENRVMAGQVTRTMLPTRLDAMAGMRRGRIYAVRNVRVRAGERTFVIALADGKRVYVPMKCGNLSVLRTAPRRVVARAHPAALRPRPRIAAATVPPPAPPVSPPAAESVAAPLVAGVQATTAAPSVAAVIPHQHNFALPFFAWLAGSITSVTSNGSPPLPACTDTRTSDAGACVGN